MGFARINKRIGTIDFGVVLDRDRSLTNITKDSRLQNKPSPNPESVLGRFMAKANTAEGFSRPNRFYINIIPPRAMNPNEIRVTQSDSEINGFQNVNHDGYTLTNDVQAFCSKIDIPDRTMVQKEIKYASSPARKFVNEVTYGDVTATFYCDKMMMERNFFELWQQAAYNTESHNFEYYDNYVGHIEIFQLGSFTENNNQDDICHAVRLWDCYPKSIGDINLDFGSTNTIGTITVTFSYRYWENYAIDNKGEVSGRTGKSSQNPVEIVDSHKGFLGGIIKRLPPVLRRPIRNAAEQFAITNNPIGAITNGRVIPPFGNPIKMIKGLF